MILFFFDSDRSTFTYVSARVLNYDPAVKCIRLNPKGTMATASGNPFFALRFRVRIKKLLPGTRNSLFV